MKKFLVLLTLPFFLVGESVDIETTMGHIEVKLFPEVAPKAVKNFITHANDGYYNGLNFHRIIKNFMIQGGDPSGNGTGGESIWGSPFEDEFDSNHKFDRKGILAMANRGPKTNGSQFFITTVPTPWLNNRHTIFGEVTNGLDVLQAIESVPTDSQGRPDTPVKILSIKVTR